MRGAIPLLPHGAYQEQIYLTLSNSLIFGKGQIMKLLIEQELLTSLLLLLLS
jgi:hypothetical protein